VEQAGWSPLVHTAFRLHDHPQETTENSVDLGHFAFVHHYEDVRSLRDLQTAGPYLSTVYAVRRRIPFISSLVRSARIGFEFETQIYGLGYSLVNVRFPSLPVNARLWVLPTPANQDYLILRFAVMTYCDSAFLRPLNPLFAHLMLAGLSHDARQDFPIWEHKRYTHPPALARGDGPIGKYRQWAKQFYAL
jgi:hypothetical protein